MTYEKIELEEALKLLSGDKKVYVKNPYVSDIYDEMANDYNPELTWSEIANLLYKTQFYKKVN